MSIKVNGTLLGGGGSTVTAEAVGEVLGDALSGDGVAAGVREVLSERTALPDAGWTDATTGTGSVAHAAGVHTLEVDSSSSAEALYASPATPECPALELIARLDVTSGAPATDWWGAIELRSEDGADALITQVIETGAVQAWRVLSTTGTMLASSSGGAVDLTTGNTYLRLVVTPTLAAYYYGVGSGDTLPTSWTKVHEVAADAGQYARGALTRVGVRVGRTASGSGTYATEFRSVQTRILGIAP